MKKPRGHLIENRMIELAVGVIMFTLASYLLWDAFDGRGKSVPWPISAATPW